MGRRGGGDFGVRDSWEPNREGEEERKLGLEERKEE